MSRTQRLIETMLTDQSLIDTHPHQLFMIATLRDIPDLAANAARATLNMPISPLLRSSAEMRQISGEKLQMLHNFHRECSMKGFEVVRNTVGSIPDEAIGNDMYEGWLTYHQKRFKFPLFVWWEPKGHDEGCGPYSDEACENSATTSSFPASWFDKHMERVMQQLKSVPAHGTVKELVVRADAISNCTLCQCVALEDLGHYADLLAAAIKNAHEEVRRKN
jgi:hypothetical protein